jgi:hypothetical protein
MAGHPNDGIDIKKVAYMKKRLAALHLVLFLPQLLLFVLFALLQLYRCGVPTGLYNVVLAWSLYVLCIPAAHGRMVIGAPLSIFFRRQVLPEPWLWALAASVNIVAMLFVPFLYLETLPAYLLHRILTMPEYWPILVVSAFGTWFRVIFSFYHGDQRYMLRTVRHLVQIAGILLFLYLTHYDLILLCNAVANG